MRILVTGSRDWDDPDTVDDAICDNLVTPESDVAWIKQYTVVHGACPTGADAHARLVVERLRAEFGDDAIAEEAHPAQWHVHGRAAGPIRNQEMVDLGADVCLAFPLPGSRGTADCMRRARDAGIIVLNYGAEIEL